MRLRRSDLVAYKRGRDEVTVNMDLGRIERTHCDSTCSPLVIILMARSYGRLVVLLTSHYLIPTRR
jgi:hypothetical protein